MTDEPARREQLAFGTDQEDMPRDRHWIHLDCGGRVVVELHADTPWGVADILKCTRCQRHIAWS